MTDSEQIVYISCVEEVRYSFVSHLSEALRLKGIHEFVDCDDLLSKESQSMVEGARVSVMILPGNRTICLDKLVKVLECQKNIDQVVVPVLYGVRSLESEWLSALDSKGFSSVHQSRKECSDSQLVKEIVSDVYEKLFYMERIGIYSKLLEIEKMVCKQPFGIRCVGIWGMPGIGKTTLAKAVFDQMSGAFDAYCFIEDYTKAIQEKGLYRLLEEQFLKEKAGAGGSITKSSLLRHKLNNKRVLVVLDDVRNPLAVESFLGGFDWFGPKSLIIITSRDKKVFRLCRVNQIYEVQGLNEKEALRLFSLCASINHMAEQNLHEVSVKVIKYTEGHPLALNIYGSELKGKRTLSEMETAFLKLKRRPPFKIIDAFKSIYDTLSDSEKNIFLDIACFFQGENVDYVMQLLEGCGFFPHVGIDVLVEKSLVAISDNCVRMHNLIQDAGREIIMGINGETVHIERRSRLWEPGSVKYLLEDSGEKENGEPKTTFKRSQGTKEIEGMFLDTSNLSFDAKPAAFENMLNLRLLKIYCSIPKNHPVINFPKGSLQSLPNELRLLHWENYSLQSLPQSFDPSHLVEINMPYSQLQKLWDGTENLEMLRTIRLCHSQQLVDIGDLLKAQNLEVIDLQGCTRLQSFPATGKLLHLRVVNLSGCTEVKSFPEIPPNIETLHLQGTGIKKLPIIKPNGGELVSLSELKGLSDALKLDRLTSLEKSSLSSQVLGKLICLNLSGCSELKTIKGFPRNLKQLYIAGTAVKKVPQLPQSLQLLSAHGCVSLKSIHFDFEKLPVHYTFSNCFDLSPEMVNVFLVKALSNAEHIPRERQQELKESLAFSFCAPSHAKNNSTLDLKPGSSVMTRLIPSWRNTLVGFAMLVEVAFPEDYCDATGFGIRCVCKWKNKEGHSHRIERNLHCWALGKAVQKAHMFVFCDVNMRPSTDEGYDPNIWADFVVFEFFPVSKQTKPLDDCCTVTRCGVRVITAANCNTSLENISPVLSLDPMEFSGYENEEVLRDNYDDLQEMEKVLFLYIACLFNDEDVDFVAPLIANIIDMDVSSGLKVLAERSLIHVSSNGEIVMHYLLRQMGREFLRLPGSSKKSERLVENSQSSMTTHSKNTGNWTDNLSDVPKKKRKADHVVPSDLWDSEKYSDDYPNKRSYLKPVEGERDDILLDKKSDRNPKEAEIVQAEANNDTNSSSSLPPPPTSLSRIWRHHVFPSFYGADVRRSFLSHILESFRRKGIDPFIDNDIERGKSVGPELIEAMRGSKIAIVLLSRKYASSSWCLNELVEIMKCREELSQIVIPIYYEVDPSDVRKQTGEFGDVFRETCEYKTSEHIERWRKALADVAKIAGEHSRDWSNEAAMIEKIATDVSDMLNSFTPSRDFDGFVGMRAHIERMEQLLRLDLDEVRMIGIWGPPGIGKTTIARVLFNQVFDRFQLGAFMVDIKGCYPRPCLDEYSAQLQLQNQMLSQIINQKDIIISHFGVAQERLKDKKISHLGVAQEWLKDKKVILVLDDVDRLTQLDALAKETRWFGPGSRIIVTTEDLRVLKAHGINHIYKVKSPSSDEASQIFCMHAFGQKYPDDGFEELAWKVMALAGNLPLGLKVLGSALRGMSKQEWIGILPSLKRHLDEEIEGVLRFSYDALGDEEKELFLYLACLFIDESAHKVEEVPVKKFPIVGHGLYILAEISLISIENGMIKMPTLLNRFGREASRKQFRREASRKKFVHHGLMKRGVLNDDTIEAEIFEAEAKSRKDDNFLGESNNDTNSSFSPYNDTNSSSSSLPSPPTILSPIWKHHVYPSFHGPDVRKSFLSHILESFRRKGIDPFIDNDIERGKSVGPELIEAMRGSKIAIVLLSRKYASSSWCLNELVEIMKCREELSQIVIPIYYEVDPSDVRKQTGEFGDVFRETCEYKTSEHIERWRKALADVANITGEHSRNWSNEAAMIEKIATDVSNMLNSSTPSRDFDGLVGMRAHMERMEQLLRLDLDEVRMIGIWGPLGIGKTTIAKVLFNQVSDRFQLGAFMVDIKGCYPRPCLDEYSAQLQLQNQMLSQIIYQKDIKISHLGVAQERLKDKKVILVLDDVDRLTQLDALAKETRWFGPGSRIIVTTEDLRVLKAHGINHIYKVNFPSSDEASQIFCMHAFGQKYPDDGFKELAWKVMALAGNLPLELKVLGSVVRGMSKQEWEMTLPRLKSDRNTKEAEIC